MSSKLSLDSAKIDHKKNLLKRPWKQKGKRHREIEQEEMQELIPVLEESEGEESENDIVEMHEEQVEQMSTQNLRQKMSTLPLAKLLELKTKLGTELFNKALYGKGDDQEVASTSDKAMKKSNSKRPREESSTRPPPKLRPIVGIQLKKKKNARFDPRFSSVCGDFDEVAFHRDYAFLDDFRQRDMQELQKAYRQAKKEQRMAHADRIKHNILRLKNQQKSSQDQKLMQQIRAELRQSNIDRMNIGQAPIYLNTNELKERFLERRRQIYGEDNDRVTEKNEGKGSETGSNRGKGTETQT